MTDKTLSFYLNALRRLFVIEDVPAWQLSLRSKIAIRTTKKTLNFWDLELIWRVVLTIVVTVGNTLSPVNYR